MAGGGYDTLFDSNIITAGESRRPGHDDKALPDHPGRRPRAGDGEGEAALRRASDTLATVSSGAAAGSGVPAGTDIRLRTATDAVARVGAPRAGQVHDESRPRRSFDGFCTAPEAAARLGISRAGIGHLVRSGRLKAIKDKGIWLIPTEEVEAYHPSSRRRHNRTDILVLIRPRDGEWPCGTPEHGLIQELGRPPRPDLYDYYPPGMMPHRQQERAQGGIGQMAGPGLGPEQRAAIGRGRRVLLAEEFGQQAVDEVFPDHHQTYVHGLRD